MMKQPHTLLNKRDAQAFSGLKDGRVVLATRGRGDVSDAGAAGAEDVVSEGELGFF